MGRPLFVNFSLALLCAGFWLGFDGGFLTTANTAHGGELTTLLENAAGNVHAILKSQNVDTTRLNVSGPSTLSTSASSTLTQLFGERLTKLGVKLGDRVKFAVNVKVKPKTEEFQAGAAIDIFVVDGDDEKFVENNLGGTLSNTEEVMTLLGLSGNFADTSRFKPGNSRIEQDVIKEAITNPKVSVRDNVARSAETSPFGVQVLVGNALRPIENRDGFAFTTLGFDDEYVIRIFNQANHEASVAVRVDGLSNFHFSTLRATDGARQGEPKFRYFVIAPRSAVDVKGWEIDSQRVKAFRIVPREDSLAAKLGIEQDIGVIHVEFYASWSDDRGIPADEPAARDRGKLTPKSTKRQIPAILEVRTRNGSTVTLTFMKEVASVSQSSIGTTFGSDLLVSTTGVQRTIGFLRDGVSIRYRLPK